VGSFTRAAGSAVFVPPIEFPGHAELVVADVEVEPFGRACPDGSQISTLRLGTNGYPACGARVTARYRTLPDAHGPPRSDLPLAPPGTLLSYHADLGTQTSAVPGRVWHWVDPPDNAPVPPDRVPRLVIPTGDFQLTWHRVPLPPWDAIRDLRGKINEDPFVGAPAGAVLFVGVKATRQFHFAADDGFWTLEYAFRERTVPLAGGQAGWNYHYKEVAVGGEHWVPIADDSGNGPYRFEDFQRLFAFEAP
jgi:hypothetical protein